jgi:hypothetical protein
MLVTSNFSARELCAELYYTGASSLNILEESARCMLLAEARKLKFQQAPEEYGEFHVKQHFSSIREFPLGSPFLHLRDIFQNFLEGEFARWGSNPFATPLAFDDIVLQKYEKTALGIGPHRDSIGFENLICIFNLGGTAHFNICADREGNYRRVIDSSPGNVIFLRAPGFRWEKERPFHFVSDIEDERYSFTLRQKRDSSVVQP